MEDLVHLTLAEPPEFLYFAVDISLFDIIMKHGLNRLKMPFIELSENEYEAKRKTKVKVPYSFTVLAEYMRRDGFVFCKTDSGEWLTDDIPSKYIRLNG